MRNGFMKICVCLFMLCSLIYGNGVLSAHSRTGEISECSECLVASFTVNPSDLEIQEDEIFVKIEGNFYPVRALERRGDRWVAHIATRFCPGGHSNCEKCGLCHRKKCWHYVPYCKQWEDE